MTKRDRLSFALRRLRELKKHQNHVLRVQETHRIIKEVVDELSKGTKNADLGHHVIELLDDLYDQNTSLLEEGQFPTSSAVPDDTEPLCDHLQTLKTIASDDIHTRQADIDAVLHHVLSLFAHGPYAQSMQALLATLKEMSQRVPTLPLPILDYSDQLQPYIDALKVLGEKDDSDLACDEAARILCQALSIFAQGPNEPSILTMLSAFEAVAQPQSPLISSPPDDAEPLRLQMDRLMALENLDDPDAVTAAAAMVLYDVLGGLAHGPNAMPIRALLDTFDRVTGAA